MSPTGAGLMVVGAGMSLIPPRDSTVALGTTMDTTMPVPTAASVLVESGPMLSDAPTVLLPHDRGVVDTLTVVPTDWEQ